MSTNLYMKNMNVLYGFGNFLGLLAPVNERSFKKFKVQVIFLIIFIVFVTIGSVYLKLSIMNTHRTIPTFINVIAQLLSVSIISIIIFRAGFFSIEEFNSLKALFKDVDAGLKSNEVQVKPGKWYTVFKFILLMFITTIVIDLVISRSTPRGLVGLLIGNICDVYFVVSIMLVCNYAFLINTRLHVINKQIESLLERHKCCSSDSEMSYESQNLEIANLQEDLTRIRVLFNSALQIHSIYNMCFGWVLLFIMFTIFAALLEQIDYLILVILKVESVKGIDNPATILGYIAIECLNLCIMGVVIAVVCSNTSKEAKNTATICYNLLSKIPADSNTSQDRVLREELILLAEHATNQCPHFSAAGFFNVNYSMLLGFLGTLTSYVIVLIQINT